MITSFSKYAKKRDEEVSEAKFFKPSIERLEDRILPSQTPTPHVQQPDQQDKPRHVIMQQHQQGPQMQVQMHHQALNNPVLHNPVQSPVSGSPFASHLAKSGQWDTKAAAAPTQHAVAQHPAAKNVVAQRQDGGDDADAADVLEKGEEEAKKRAEGGEGGERTEAPDAPERKESPENPDAEFGHEKEEKERADMDREKEDALDAVFSDMGKDSDQFDLAKLGFGNDIPKSNFGDWTTDDAWGSFGKSQLMVESFKNWRERKKKRRLS